MEKIKFFLSKVIKKWHILLLTLLFVFVGGYFITDGINYFNAKYECSFQTNITIVDDLLSYEALKETRDSAEKYAEIDVDSLFIDKGIYLEKVNDSYKIITYSRYYEDFFIKSSSSISTRAKKFIEDHLKYHIGEDHVTYQYESIIIQTDYINEYLVATIASAIILIPLIILFGFQKEKEKIQFYNNTDTFKTPFHAEYWKKASSFYDSPRNLTLMAMLFAMMLISKIIPLPSGFGNLGLSLGYLFFSIIGLTYGPLAGMLIGFLSDILGYFLFDTSGYSFFIGYAFQAMISGLIYGIIFYRTKISFKRVFLARLLISVVSNILIGSVCFGIVANYNFEQTIAYMVLLSLPKNIIFLIPQSILLYIVFKAVIPLLSRFRYIDSRIAKHISLI